MGVYPASITRLIARLSRLPGIGEKTAERLALHIVNGPASDARELAESIRAARESAGFCAQCHGLSDEETCHICRDPGRDPAVLCVVENPTDLVALEKAGAFKGRYHVLLGTLSPMNGVGPEALTVAHLMERTAEGGVSEVILATSTTVEGEATAAYLARELAGLPVSVTRIACGIPIGGDLKYTDALTLKRALSGRLKMGG